MFLAKLSRLSEDAICGNTREVLTLCNIYNVVQANFEL